MQITTWLRKSGQSCKQTPERQSLGAFLSGIPGKNVLYQGMQRATKVLQYAYRESYHHC